MPTALLELLQQLSWYKADNDPSVNPCQGSKFHSPRPLRVRSYQLLNGKRIFLCGTCKDNSDLYRGLQDFHKGSLPWPVQRSFGNELRKVSDYILKYS